MRRHSGGFFYLMSAPLLVAVLNSKAIILFL